LRKLKSVFLSDVSYQLWLKSIQWFWRRRGKVTDGGRKGGDRYCSLEPSAQVSLKSYRDIFDRL